MPWIACDVGFPLDPKTLDLADFMGWEPHAAAGRLLAFWGWCLQYAYDGDLSRLSYARIAQGMGLPAVDGGRLVEAMVKTEWLDDKPYLRIHDWWSLVGMFLRGRYQREPQLWQRVQKLYGADEKPKKGGKTATSDGGDDPQRESACSGAVQEQDPTCTGAAHEQDATCTGAAHEQDPICTGAAHEQEYRSVAALEQLHTTEHNSTRHNSNSTEPPPSPPTPPPRSREAEGGGGGGDGGFKKTIDKYKALKYEITERSGKQKFSRWDERRLLKLLGSHGDETIEACRHLHGGVKNIPAYLSVVLEGKDDIADLIQEAQAILKKGTGT